MKIVTTMLLLLMLVPAAILAQTTINGDINSVTEWTVEGSPYIITAEVKIWEDLTILPGVEVIFVENRDNFYVKNAATLTATGVIFNGWSEATSGASIAMYDASTSGIFTDCTFDHVHVSTYPSANSYFSGNTFVNNNHYAGTLHFSNGYGTVNFHNNYFCGDIAVAVKNDGRQLDITNNWFGDPTGPYNETLNPTGQGREVIGDVIISPWLTGGCEPSEGNCQSLLVGSGPAGGGNSLRTLNTDGVETWGCDAIKDIGMAKWSADKSRIVYRSIDPTTGKSEIWVANSDCNDVQQLTNLNDYYGQKYPHFSPNSKIWWTRSMGAGHSELCQMNDDGTSITLLSNFHSSGKQITQTDLSTDKIYYVLQNSSSSPSSEIYKADINPTTGVPDWTTQVQLTFNGNREGSPAISPGDTKIAYDRSDGSHLAPFNVWVMNADGSGATKLTHGTGNTYFYMPLWSPDGTKIVCTYADGTQADLYMMNADGSNLTNITNTPNQSEYASDWSDVCALTSQPITGFATVGGTGLHGVAVDLFDDAGIMLNSAVTDEFGYYEFVDLTNGIYTVSITSPLGFISEVTIKEVNLAGQPMEVNFELQEIQIADGVFHCWWWKKQFELQNIEGIHPSHIHITPEDVDNYNELIFDHFYSRTDEYAIQLESITYTGNPARPITYEEMSALFLAPYEDSFEYRYKRSLRTNLLNIASGRMSQTKIVSADGATASQAIIYLVGLFETGERKNMYYADIFLQFMHAGWVIPAGYIDLNTPNIMFKDGDNGDSSLPIAYSLSQNYPNPFNPTTEIAFSLSSACDVSLEIFNIMGQKVTTLVDRYYEAGRHIVTWDASKAASGVYFYRLTTGNYIESKKMVLLK